MSLCCLVLLASCTCLQPEESDKPPEGWGGLAAPAMGFAVTIPDGHKRQIVTEKDPNGDAVKVTLYRATRNNITYVVAISEFNKTYLSQPKQEIYENARNSSITRSKGKLVGEKDVKTGKHEGREFIVAAGMNAGFVRARLFVANDRQYSVMVAGKIEAAIDDADAKRFLDSFKIGPIKTGK